jgi:hypothetical protein
MLNATPLFELVVVVVVLGVLAILAALLWSFNSRNRSTPVTHCTAKDR